MNTWLINLFDPMSRDAAREARMVGLATAFCDAGHSVTWWTSDWDHANKVRRQPGQFLGHPWAVEVLPTLAYHRNTSLRRFRSHARFARDWRNLAREGIRSGRLKTPDMVFVNLPPPSVGAAVADLKTEFGFFMVVDVQDAWPENFSQLLPFGSKWNERIGARLFAPLKRSARKAYRAADVVTAVSQDYLDVVAGYGVRDAGDDVCPDRSGSGKLHKPQRVFYIGCPADRLDEVPIAFEDRDNSIFRLVYVGSLSTSYDLETLIQAMAAPELSGRAVELHFAGAGDAMERLKERSRKLRVVFHGMLNQPELRALLERCHLGLNAVKPASRIAMPNKIGDYFAAGLPVLHAVPRGELADLIRMHNLGTLYQAGDASGLAKVIAASMDRPEGLAAQSANARRFAERSLDRRELYPAMVDFVVNAAKSVRAAR
jgi:glycosyltransferase involved in cell wall biosynthesis